MPIQGIAFEVDATAGLSSSAEVNRAALLGKPAVAPKHSFVGRPHFVRDSFNPANRTTSYSSITPAHRRKIAACAKMS